MPHDHDHPHALLPPDPALRVKAIETLLVDKGLVERGRAVDDQRSIVVSATMAGRERYGELSQRVQRGLNQMLADFTPEEQVLLADYLERFVLAVDKLAASADQQ